MSNGFIIFAISLSCSSFKITSITQKLYYCATSNLELIRTNTNVKGSIVRPRSMVKHMECITPKTPSFTLAVAGVQAKVLSWTNMVLNGLSYSKFETNFSPMCQSKDWEKNFFFFPNGKV